jgi:hypothetical protein
LDRRSARRSSSTSARAGSSTGCCRGPVRDHVGTVELAADDGGTRVVYRIDSTPAIPLVAPVIAAVARAMIRKLFNGIVKEAERRARTGG